MVLGVHYLSGTRRLLTAAVFTGNKLILISSLLYLIVLVVSLTGIYLSKENKLSTLVAGLGNYLLFIGLYIAIIADKSALSDFPLSVNFSPILILILFAYLLIPNRFLKLGAGGSTSILWATTIVSILMAATLFLMPIAIFTAPVGLMFGQLYLRSKPKEASVLYAVYLNLILITIIGYKLFLPTLSN